MNVSTGIIKGESFGPITYQNILLEHPPKGSAFTTTGGYVITDCGYIPRELRKKVWKLREEYAWRDPRDPKDFRFVGEPREGNSLKNYLAMGK